MKGKIKGIYLRGNLYWLSHQRNGKRVFVSLKTDDYVQAVKNAAEFLNSPDLLPSEGLKADYTAWIEDRVKYGVWTRQTKTMITSFMARFGQGVGWIPTHEITTKHIQKYYDEARTRMKEVSAANIISYVRGFMNWCVKQKRIRTNPCVGVVVAKHIPRARTKFCTFEQRDKIIEAAKGKADDLMFILYCGFFAGMRKNEIIEARPDWFDLAGSVIHVRKTETFTPKNKKDRTIPMSTEMKAFIQRYGFRSPFMLRPDVTHGKGLYRYSFEVPFNAHMKDVGMEWVTPHVMRHTFASLLASRGCSLYKIATWLGDTLTTTQKHYAHLLPVDEDINLASSASPSSSLVTADSK